MLLGYVYADVSVQRRENLAKVHGSIRGFTALRVGSPDNLSVVHASAGKKHGHNLTPMITPSFAVNLRSPPELAPNDHRDVVQHGAIPQILYEVGHPLVEIRQVLVAKLLEIIVVRIPSAGGQRNESGTRLHYPPGQEETLAVVAIALDRLGFLVLQIESLGKSLGGDDIESLPIKGVETIHHAGCITITAKLIEPTKQALAIGVTNFLHARLLCHIVTTLASAAEAGMSRAEKASTLYSASHIDVTRSSHVVAVYLRDDGTDGRPTANGLRSILRSTRHAMVGTVVVHRIGNRTYY